MTRYKPHLHHTPSHAEREKERGGDTHNVLLLTQMALKDAEDRASSGGPGGTPCAHQSVGGLILVAATAANHGRVLDGACKPSD